MPAKKEYGSIASYEKKLENVMKRFGVEPDDYEYDWTRKTAFVRFKYHGQWYMFDHSVEKANATGKFNLTYGSDVFAQLILALEDLARMSERGIYDLSTWISGMKYLPQKENLPECFQLLGFTGSEYPTKEDLEARYRNLLKEKHPDNGGDKDDFINLQENMKKCLEKYD